MLKVSYLIKWIQVSSIMGLSVDLPNLIHIHIFIARSNFWHCSYLDSLVAFLDYFVEELVSSLTNHVAGQGCLIQVESRVCRPQQCWHYKVVAPSYGLKPLRRVLWNTDQRSRIGCDVCRPALTI